MVQKIVINKCFGGFGLSIEAQKLINKLGCPHTEVKTEQEYFGDSELSKELDIKYYGSSKNAHKQHAEFCEIPFSEGKLICDNHDRNARGCPVLIKVVKKMGKKSWGKHAELKIVEVPDGVEWSIEEYDGSEWISEKHRTWG